MIRRMPALPPMNWGDAARLKLNVNVPFGWCASEPRVLPTLCSWCGIDFEARVTTTGFTLMCRDCDRVDLMPGAIEAQIPPLPGSGSTTQPGATQP